MHIILYSAKNKITGGRFAVHGYPSLYRFGENHMIEFKGSRDLQTLTDFAISNYKSGLYQEIPLEYSFWRKIMSDLGTIGIIGLAIVLTLILLIIFCLFKEFTTSDEEPKKTEKNNKVMETTKLSESS